MGESVRVFETFRRIRLDLDAAPNRVALRSGCILAVGILLGADFPGSAAAISILLEDAFPEVEDWPWLPIEREPPE